MKKSKPKYEKGGILNQWDLPSDPSTPGYEDYGDMYTIPRWPGLMYKDPGTRGWEGYGSVSNVQKPVWDNTEQSGTLREQPTRQLAMNAGDYSIDNLRKNNMQNGGYTNPKGMYWNGTKFVKAKGSGTYNNGTYFKEGGFNYRPFERKDGYYTFYGYSEDGGHIAELRNGGYIPVSINAQPRILQKTDGVYHMKQGGQAPIAYIPAPGEAKPHILPYSNGRYHMEFGGVHMPTPMAATGGNYYRGYPLAYDGGHIAELQYGGNFDPVNRFMPIKENGGFIQNDSDVLDGGPDELKKGGIHIKPSKRGTFTAAATKHGKSVQAFASQVLANKENYSPAMVKKANFARNAAKWHEEGGMVNPFHPLAQFANGGFGPGAYEEDPSTRPPDAPPPPVNPLAGPDPNDPNDPRNLDPAYAQQNAASRTGVVQQTPDPADTAAWRQGMTDEEAQQNLANRPSTEEYAAQFQKGPTGWQKAAMWGNQFNNLLGAGLMTASHFANRKNEKNMAAYNRSLGMSTNMPMVAGSKGDWSQQGNFRPNGNVPTQPGNYRPGGMKIGGAVEYKKGGEYVLDDITIKKLIDKGYKIEYV